MKFNDWLIHNLRHENWFSHLIMFFTTVLGILIALQLDKGREEVAQKEKLDMFRIRLNNELKINKTNLINKKLSLLRTYAILEISLDKVKQPDGQYLISRHLADSLIQLDSSFQDLILNRTELPNDQLSVGFNLNLINSNTASDTWQAVKGSDIIQQLNPLELIQYTNIYQILQSQVNLEDVYTIFKESSAHEGLSNAMQREVMQLLEEKIFILYNQDTSLSYRSSSINTSKFYSLVFSNL
jgi:hypothetical protein